MNQNTINEIIDLIQEGYRLYKTSRETNNMELFGEADKKLELADAMIHASTKPKYFPTGEGWDLMLIDSPSKDELNPPTRESLMEWFKARSLA